MPGAGQCRSLGAGRPQAVSRSVQAVGDVGRSGTIRGVACGGDECPQGVGAAPGAVTEQAQDLQGYDVARDSLLNAVGDPFGLCEISLLIQGTEELEQCVDHREIPVRESARYPTIAEGAVGSCRLDVMCEFWGVVGVADSARIPVIGGNLSRSVCCASMRDALVSGS